VTTAVPSTVTIRSMRQEDWLSVRSIYQEGIDTGHATFEPEAPGWEAFDSSRLARHRLVAETTPGRIVGWAAVAPVSARPVYSGVVEHSVYVASAARGLGIGKALLEALIESTERHGIWTMQASVFPENEASLKLHLADGFSIVGRRQRIARMNHGLLNGQWRDTLLIERRSPSI
jgi:L-amino acid N-acyltransferase YncA